MSRRRWLVPEVIQTSAMDCGPACLTALLAGHGVRASYERLREACRTDVDGTSIDTIEEAATQLGLDAEQNIVPVDHVLRAEADALPAIVITRQPDGGNHFIVVWNQVAGRVQVMDPAVGRRWVSRERLLAELYVHAMDLPAEVWRDWAGAGDRASPLAARLRELGVGDAAARVARCLDDPGATAVATLDAATRLVRRFVDTGAIGAGGEATALLDVVVGDPSVIPDDAWSAQPTGDPAAVRVRGAVIVRVRGIHAASPASPELRAALAEAPATPWRHLAAAASNRGLSSGGPKPEARGPACLLGVIAVTALLVVVQAALWRTLFDTEALTTVQLGGALATLVAYLAIELAIEVAVVGAVYRLGRRVELGLRAHCLAAIARLGLRYLASRPISDLTERSHALHRLRELPWIGAQLLRVGLATLFTGAALIWLAPETWALVGALALAVIVPPLAAHGALAERELRVRTHHGAITKFFLDALLGAIPARAHVVERPLRREHESRLVAWVGAANREHAFATAIAAAQSMAVYALAIAVIATHVSATARPASVLLAVYWTVAMATNAGAFAALVRELPAARNLTLRLLEPLGARVADPDDGARHVGALVPAGDPTAPPFGGADRGAQVPAGDPTAPPFGGADRRAQVAAGDPTAPPFGGADRGAQVPAGDPTAPPFGGADRRAQVAAGDPTAPPFGGADRRAQVPAIGFEDVSVVAGGHPVLAGVTLEIAVGQHVAVVGASGSGKSTLLGLVLGWHRPATGTIRIGDAPLDAAMLAALRRRLAWVDPAVRLWNDSLVHNLGFGVDGAVDVGAVVVDAQLDDVLGRLPAGMQTRLGEGGGLLSGGEGQRVRFGRGLARDGAALVVLDEPFRGIDRARRHTLLASARERWRGVTLLCATHDIVETAAFDRVLVVDGGRVVEDAAPSVLAADPASRYAALLAEAAAAHACWRTWRSVVLEGGRVVSEVRAVGLGPRASGLGRTADDAESPSFEARGPRPEAPS